MEIFKGSFEILILVEQKTDTQIWGKRHYYNFETEEAHKVKKKTFFS
jgi:hypothetical protein